MVLEVSLLYQRLRRQNLTALLKQMFNLSLLNHG